MQDIQRMLKEVSEREIFIVAVLISLLLVFSFFFFIHIPLKEAYNSEMAERAKLAETETTIVNFKDAHLDSEAYKKELSDQDARMTAAIPDDLRQGEFLALLEQRAIFSHVELIGVTPETEVKEAEYRSLPLTVEFRGNYVSILDFIQEIEDSDRFIQVDSFEILNDGKFLTCKLRLFIYAMLDKSA